MNIILLSVIFLTILCTFCALVKYEFEHLNSLDKNYFQLCFISCIFSFLFVSIGMFIAALIGMFSSRNIIVVCCLQIILVYFGTRNRQKIIGKRKYIEKAEVIFVVVLVICSFLYMTNCTEYLWGRRDYGLYIIKGINIAKTHEISLQEDEYISENYEKMKDIIDLEFRGTYSTLERGDSKVAGEVSLQFLDYTPVLLAIGYELCGLDGIFHTNAIVSILGLVALYYCIKCLFNENIALISSFIIGINPAQIWSARITQTEIVYQLFWLVGILTFCYGWKYKKEIILLGSGIIWGLIGINRIDSYILGVALICLGIYLNLFRICQYKYMHYTIGGYVSATIASVLYSFKFSYYYFSDHWKNAGLREIVILNLILLCVYFFTYRMNSIEKLYHYNILDLLEKRKHILLVICFVFWIVIKTVYFYRPLLQLGINADRDFDKRALVEVAWYTTPLLVFTFPIGIYFVMDKIKNNIPKILFIISGFMMSVIYIARPGVAPDHPWASRRWVAVVIPYIICIALVGIIYFLKHNVKKRIFKYLLMSVIVFYLITEGYKMNKVFLNEKMLGDFQEQYEQLITYMENENYYLVEASHYGSILKYVYGKNTILLNEKCTAEDIEKYILEVKEPVYFIGSEKTVKKLVTKQIEEKCMFQGQLKGVWIDEQQEKFPQGCKYTGMETNIYIIDQK